MTTTEKPTDLLAERKCRYTNRDRRPEPMRRFFVGAVLVAAVASVGACTPVKPAPPHASPPAPAHPQPQERTVAFEFTGSAQVFVVPAGVTQLTVDAYGAQSGELLPLGLLGAPGGRATVTIAVTAGEALIINVGGQGSATTSSAVTGGFNGGGTSGAPTSGAPGGLPTASGGGASDVRRTGWTLADRLVVAGGGGGQSAVAPGGGGGGGLVGVTGAGPGGGGGTQTMGGAAGPAGVGNTAGSLLTGGTGSNGGVATPAGGGGGGGLYGGGGGGSGGGGGGGSGFGPPGTVFETGVRAGNGRVVVTYTQP